MIMRIVVTGSRQQICLRTVNGLYMCVRQKHFSQVKAQPIGSHEVSIGHLSIDVIAGHRGFESLVFGVFR